MAFLGLGKRRRRTGRGRPPVSAEEKVTRWALKEADKNTELRAALIEKQFGLSGGDPIAKSVAKAVEEALANSPELRQRLAERKLSELLDAGVDGYQEGAFPLSDGDDLDELMEKVDKLQRIGLRVAGREDGGTDWGEVAKHLGPFVTAIFGRLAANGHQNGATFPPNGHQPAGEPAISHRTVALPQNGAAGSDQALPAAEAPALAGPVAAAPGAPDGTTGQTAAAGGHEGATQSTAVEAATEAELLPQHPIAEAILEFLLESRGSADVGQRLTADGTLAALAFLPDEQVLALLGRYHEDPTLGIVVEQVFADQVEAAIIVAALRRRCREVLENG